MSRYALSVIIPTHQRYPQLRDLLNSIQRQSVAEGVEVLVVSNLPEDDTKTLVGGLGSDFRYLCSESVGVNKARNLGIEASSADILIFLDDDCYLSDTSFFEKVVSLHRTNEQSSAIGGVYVLGEKSNWASGAYHWIADHWLWTSIDKGRKTRNLIGGNLTFKKCKLDKLRFDETIAFGGAETELLHRMYNSGHELLFFPELKVEHRLSVGNVDFVRKAYMQGISAGRRLEKMEYPLKKTRPMISFERHLKNQRVKKSGLFNLYYRVYDFSFDLGRHRKSPMNWKWLLLMAWGSSFARFLFDYIGSWYDDVFAAMGFSIKDHDSIR